MFFEELSISFIDKLKESEYYEFYHSAAYLDEESKALKGSKLYWHYESNQSEDYIIFCLIKRQIDNSKYYDVVSPYGYPGYVSNSNDTNFINKALYHYNQECKDIKIVSTFIRMSPINNCIMLKENRNLKHIIHGNVITVPLNNIYQNIYSDYSSNHKRSIKKSKNLNYTIEEAGLESIHEFIDIYNKTMSRLNASKYYFFTQDYYEALYETGLNVDLVFVKDTNGRKVSGALFMSNEIIIQYHLGGTIASEIRNSPNKLLFDHIISKYSNQNKILNLGGGLGNESDSLFDFKKGFSENYHKFSTLRMIHLPEQYTNLCQSLSKSEIRDLTAFFPLYRV